MDKVYHFTMPKWKAKPLAAVALSLNGNHAGIIFSFSDGAFSIRMLHLRVNADGRGNVVRELKNLPELQMGYIVPNIAEPLRRAVATNCKQTWKYYENNVNATVPYGFKCLPSGSWERNGALKSGETCAGMTCAALVHVMFKSAGINLLDELDWAPATDADVNDRIKLLRASPALGHLMSGAELKSARIHPIEVAGAAHLYKATASKQIECKARGKEILDYIKSEHFKG